MNIKTHEIKQGETLNFMDFKENMCWLNWLIQAHSITYICFSITVL